VKKKPDYILSSTLDHNIMGRIIYRAPMRFVFVYLDGHHTRIKNVKVFAAVKTGCYVLTLVNGDVVSVAPGHRYVWTSPMVRS
jgi:hypothetical protein